MADSQPHSRSASVSPPTPDTPLPDRQATQAGTGNPLSPDPRNVSLNMQEALDAAAKPTNEEAALSPAAYQETLWDILGIPPPAVSASQHECTRVVLMGRALSGKRTVCRRLCIAAERQFPSSAADDDERQRAQAAGRDDDRRGLYWPPEDGDDSEDTEEWPEAEAGRHFNSGANHHAHMEEVAHGAGISHDYVVQRLPRSIEDARTGRSQTHRAVEFFCCDSPGALAIAIPTLESLDTVVVCHVVDVSQPCSIEDQLNTSFHIVQTHVSSILRTYLPHQDEVRRVQMMEKVEAFWLQEEARLRSFRAAVQARSADETLIAAGVNIDDVNKESLRLPQGTPTVSPLKAIIVCTKTDVLEHLSKACSDADAALTEEERAAMEVIVPGAMRDAVQAMNCTLPQLVAQLVRHYAIHHRCALAGVSSRVNTMSASGTGDQVPLVNPLYRAVWEYICYLQQHQTTAADKVATTTTPRTPGADPQGTLLPESATTGTAAAASDGTADAQTQAATAKLYPSAFLPCGLDALGLLNEFVASEQVVLPATDPMHVSTPPPEWDHAAALKSCAVENGFETHQAYLQGVSNEFGGACDTSEWMVRAGGAFSGRGDEPMLWDTLQ